MYIAAWMVGQVNECPRPARPRARRLRHETTAPARILVAMNGRFVDAKRVE
jgi:hypothetical protein